jgi:pimeloyl-ACP methyl ester carboxylesterase
MVRDLRAIFSNSSLAPHRANVDALVLNMLPPRLKQWAFDQFVPESSRATRELAFGLVRVDPRRLSCPMLVVGAEHDMITPVVVQRKIAARYHAEYLELPGHAHMLMLEDGWERSIRQILAWAERAIRS